MDRRKFMENLQTITVAGAGSLHLDFAEGKDKKPENEILPDFEVVSSGPDRITERRLH